VSALATPSVAIATARVSAMHLFARLRRAVWTSVMARGSLIADVLLDARPNRAAPRLRPVKGRGDRGGACRECR
jgi:hypothetical protein